MNKHRLSSDSDSRSKKRLTQSSSFGLKVLPIPETNTSEDTFVKMSSTMSKTLLANLQTLNVPEDKNEDSQSVVDSEKRSTPHVLKCDRDKATKTDAQKRKRSVTKNKTVTKRTKPEHSRSTTKISAKKTVMSDDVRSDSSCNESEDELPQVKPPTNSELSAKVDKLTDIVQALVSKIGDNPQNSPTIPAAIAPADAQSCYTPNIANDPGELLFNLNHQARETGLNFTSGLLAGENLPERLKSKIWGDKYVDFHNLLYPDNEGTYNLTLNTVLQPGLNLTPRKNRPLSEREWNRAFDDYLAVYSRRFPQLTSDLITYGKFIKELMTQGHNWAYYDTRFRKDREFSKCSWTTIRVDLHIAAAQNSNYRTRSSSSRFVSQSSDKTSSRHIPVGYCFKYNTPGVRCDNMRCQWKHECCKCSGKHPMYSPCSDLKQNTPRFAQSKLPFLPSQTGRNTDASNPNTNRASSNPANRQ